MEDNAHLATTVTAEHQILFLVRTQLFDWKCSELALTTVVLAQPDTSAMMATLFRSHVNLDTTVLLVRAE